MDILTFYEELKALADRAKESTDPAVLSAAVVLLSLQAAMAGEDVNGLQTLVATAGMVSQNKLDEAKAKPS